MYAVDSRPAETPMRPAHLGHHWRHTRDALHSPGRGKGGIREIRVGGVPSARFRTAGKRAGGPTSRFSWRPPRSSSATQHLKRDILPAHRELSSKPGSTKTSATPTHIRTAGGCSMCSAVVRQCRLSTTAPACGRRLIVSLPEIGFCCGFFFSLPDRALTNSLQPQKDHGEGNTVSWTRRGQSFREKIFLSSVE